MPRPILCPPIETADDGKKTSMLSQELRESFETVQAIHRAQLQFDPNSNHNTHPIHNHDTYGETIDSFPNLEMDDATTDGHELQVLPVAGQRASMSSHLYGNNIHNNSNHHNLSTYTTNTNTMTEANVKAWKFEAALKAAMVAEAEISQLTNGIAELEQMLLQKETGSVGDDNDDVIVVGANDMGHHGTLFPSLPPCVMLCDDSTSTSNANGNTNEDCNDVHNMECDDDDDAHNNTNRIPPGVSMDDCYSQGGENMAFYFDRK